MIFKQFDPNQDIVAGRTTRVASGFWPEGLTTWDQTSFVDDFWSLTTTATPNPSYGTSVYDVRRTMYYTNVYPDQTHYDNADPYFSIAYGHIAGDVGSGSFEIETSSIQVSPTKAIYTQYKNLLLGSGDSDGIFTMKSGSTNITASDIWVIDFSAYKMKDRVDEGLLELTFSGSYDIVLYPKNNPLITLVDDSPYSTQTQAVYQLIEGTLANPAASPTYGGFGLFYPSNGVVIINAAKLAERIGISYNWARTYSWQMGVGASTDPVTKGPGTAGRWPYNPTWRFVNPGNAGDPGYTYNHHTLYESMVLCKDKTMKVRKSEYVPARQYFVRVMNREFNYSNNPTYVYDGTDGIHPKGTIRNADFITDPRTYITTIGLYNDNNELVAVAKLSRPAVKSFDSELLIKIRLDM